RIKLGDEDRVTGREDDVVAEAGLLEHHRQVEAAPRAEAGGQRLDGSFRIDRRRGSPGGLGPTVELDAAGVGLGRQSSSPIDELREPLGLAREGVATWV